jgi:hypothetical protein
MFVSGTFTVHKYKFSHNNNMKRKLCQIIHTKERFKVKKVLPFKTFHYFVRRCDGVVLLAANFCNSPSPLCAHPIRSCQGACDLLTSQAKHMDTLVTESVDVLTNTSRVYKGVVYTRCWSKRKADS